MGAYGGLWRPMSAYGGLWGPLGVYGDLLWPMGAYGHLWGPMGKGKGKVLGRSPNSSVSVIPTCPKAQHPTAHYISHQNSRNSGTVNSRDT